MSREESEARARLEEIGVIRDGVVDVDAFHHIERENPWKLEPLRSLFKMRQVLLRRQVLLMVSVEGLDAEPILQAVDRELGRRASEQHDQSMSDCEDLTTFVVTHTDGTSETIKAHGYITADEYGTTNAGFFVFPEEGADRDSIVCLDVARVVPQDL